MEPPSITTVIFDIGNVLIRWDVRALYRSVFDDHEEMERFLTEVWSPMENERCDRGTPYSEVIAEQSARHPAYASQIALAWDRWIETVPGEVDGAFELVQELKSLGLRLAALSNFSAETFPLIREVYPHFELLDDIVISGEHPPLAKPDPEIFALVCERNGIEPSEAVFVDDVKANTAAAASLGFATVTFTDTPALRHELRERDIGVSA